MLQTLKIKNVALIKDLEINLNKGFNVLLGETGAGKSIIFDALNFVLGAKADKTLLRSGESTMKVEALFSDLNPLAVNALQEFGVIDDGNEIVLSRSLDSDGKSVIRINGSPATALILKNVGSVLVDSYSQHEALELLKSKNHLTMLDKLGSDTIKNIKDSLTVEYEKYQEIVKKIKSLGGNEFERERTKDLLSYQIKEIEEAELYIGEADEVKERIELLSSSEKIFEAVNECENLLENSSMSAIGSVHESINLLSPLSKIDAIDTARERLNNVRYELQDIAETLKDIRDNTAFDEGELDRLDRRKDLIKLLCKKYGGSEEKVLKFLEEARVRLDELNQSEELLIKLENEKTKQEKVINQICEKLSGMRKAIAKEVEEKIVNELRELGMKSTSFVVKFGRMTDFTDNGFDEVEFTFSANKGQEVKALAKTASGGEMSRVMLAFKTIFAHAGLAETLIFDEVDAGISGEIGYVVGEKISTLAKSAQVLCVTHLPQVASQGDAFYFVSKTSDATNTYTSVKDLKGNDVIYELARMLGGNSVTEVATAHIKEMRKRAGKA